MERKYYIDEIKETLVKAYTEDGKFILEMISLIPKYRGGYHRNVFRKQFEDKDYANNYFKKLKDRYQLTATKFPGMANGHAEF